VADRGRRRNPSQHEKYGAYRGEHSNIRWDRRWFAYDHEHEAASLRFIPRASPYQLAYAA